MVASIACTEGLETPAPSFGLWIDGEERPAASGAEFHRVGPYTGRVEAHFANAGAADVDAAIVSARAAFDEGPWAVASAHERYEILQRTAELMTESAEEFIRRMVRESGKPRGTAAAELATAVRTYEFYAGLALDLDGDAVSRRVPDGLGLVLREPVGVAGLITPWNFPILNPTVKIAAALAAGCTVVAKPSHMCAGPALLLAQCLAEAGLPAGVVNIITSDIQGGALVGQVISGSPLVDQIAFTGSTRTGRAVMAAAASTTKRVSLELGGKSANIVFADADLDVASTTSVRAFCYNSGQQCSAATRLLVERRVHEEFVDRLVRATSGEVLGDPDDTATTMGPLVDPSQFERVMGYVEEGRATSTLVAGGPEAGRSAGELFVAPTIFDDVDNGSRLAQEEIFGPVLAVIPFDTEEQAIGLANDSRYGLAGGVWTSSIDRALRVVDSVRTGKMFVNCYNNSGIDDLPHGGYKDSGIGREQGPLGLEEFQQVKAVHIRIGARG